MRLIKVNLTLTFDNMDKFDKGFHVALANEIVRKGIIHLHSLSVKVDEVRNNDVSYDMSK